MTAIRFDLRRITFVLVIFVLIYLGLGFGFHLVWMSELTACDEALRAQGEFVEPEVFGNALGLFFDLTYWPGYAKANFYHDGTVFATPCTH